MSSDPSLGRERESVYSSDMSRASFRKKSFLPVGKQEQMKKTGSDEENRNKQKAFLAYRERDR